MFKSIKGQVGEITIPSIGAVVARCEPDGWWELRRVDPQPQDAPVPEWNLRALFSYLNPIFFGDSRYPLEFKVQIGPGKLFRIAMPADRMAVNGQVLQVDGGVELWELEPS